MKKTILVICVVAIFITTLAFSGKACAADSSNKTIPFHFSSVVQKLKDGIMFKSVLIKQIVSHSSVKSSGRTWQVMWGVNGYSAVGIKVCGLYTHVGWTGNGSYLTSPHWVYHSSWSVFPNTVDQISDRWLYYNEGYHGTGEALTTGRCGINIDGWEILHHTELLFTDVYWYGNWHPHLNN